VNEDSSLLSSHSLPLDDQSNSVQITHMDQYYYNNTTRSGSRLLKDKEIGKY